MLNITKKLLHTLIFAAATGASFAAEPIKIDLTPADALPDENASIEVFLPQTDTKGAVLLCPGGGYAWVSVENEGYEWVDWLNERGFAAVLLRYRLPKQRHNVPLKDCTAAMAELRKNADKWNIPANHIGVMGFSAGGHLASTMATHYTPETRPDFQVLIYPVIALDKNITHTGSRENLIGNAPQASFDTGINHATSLEALYSNDLQVTPQTPPAFILTCEDDDVVNPHNSMRYYSALMANKVPSELHIFPKGGHGYGKRATFPYVDRMLYLLDLFLNEHTQSK